MDTLGSCSGCPVHKAECSRAQDGCLAAGFAVVPTAGGGVRWLLIVVGTEVRAGPHCVSWLQAAVTVEGAHVGLRVAWHGKLRALYHLVSREPTIVAGDGVRARGRVTLSGEPELEAFRTPPGAWSHKGLWARISVVLDSPHIPRLAPPPRSGDTRGRPTPLPGLRVSVSAPLGSSWPRKGHPSQVRF